MENLQNVPSCFFKRQGYFFDVGRILFLQKPICFCKGVNDMNKFTMGMLAGGMMTVAGLGMMAQEKRATKRMIRKGKKMASRAENAASDLMDDIMNM